MVMRGGLCSEGCGFESRHVLWLEFFHIYLLQKCVQSLFENIDFPNWFSKRNFVTAAAALKLQNYSSQRFGRQSLATGRVTTTTTATSTTTLEEKRRRRY